MRLIGWKRLEVNNIFHLVGVSPQSFNSMARRVLFFKVLTRFSELIAVIKETYPDHETDGIFEADATLATFVKSGPAIAAALRLQHGFELKHGRDACPSLSRLIVQVNIWPRHASVVSILCPCRMHSVIRCHQV